MPNLGRASWERFQSAIQAIDGRAHYILACHAAIERALDRALAARLPNARFLRGLGFGQKVGVWAATQPFETGMIERMVKPMLQFNDLRNSVAHGDSRKKVGALVSALLGSVEASSSDGAEIDLEYAAGFVCGFLDMSCSFEDASL